MSTFSKLTNEIVDFGDKKHYVRDHAPTKITLHHMAVVNADPVSVAKGHRDSNRQASANYYIGSDGKIVGAVSEEFGAWTSSSKTNDKQAITVEISNSKGRPNWEISDKAYAAVIALCADICMRYGITPHYTGNSDGTLTLHCMFAKTACPGGYLKTLHETGQVELNIKQSMAPQPTPQPTPSQDIDKTIWDYLMAQIGNACGVAGLMGNIQAESGLKPNNLENSKERASGFTDATYTQAVDNGTYTSFAGDAFGYGLCQWTSSGRKSALLSLKQSKGCSIADVNLQLEHLMNELNGAYKNVLKVLKNATSVREASDIVLTKFEIPRDQSEAVKVRRADMGQKFYEKFSGAAFKPYIARITAAALNVRKGAGITYPIVMQVKKGSAYTIVEKVGEWGRLKSGVGWICLDYTQFVRYA